MATLKSIEIKDADGGVVSTSHGPVVVLKGWSKGMDKAAVTLFPRDSGIPLARAYEATNSILGNESISVRFPDGTEVASIRRQLQELGVIL
jgi:hypothetical protein